MSFTCDTIWPLRLDLSPLECRQILREKELLCYSDVVSVFRAQGPLSEEKKSILTNLQRLFSISDERHKAELRRAANNEKLSTIAGTVSGNDAYGEWASLGALKFPSTKRPIPRTIYCDSACQTLAAMYNEEKRLSSPLSTNELDLTMKQESAIATNRIATTKQHCPQNSSTNTEGYIKKDDATSLDYNLHLLSEIATGETVQTTESHDTDIYPVANLVHHQNDKIELPKTSGVNVSFGGIKRSVSDDAVVSGIIGNHGNKKRYVLPQCGVSQTINQQHNPICQLTSQHILNNQIRASPETPFSTLGQPAHVVPTWTGPSQPIYIQNVSTIDNLTSLGYTLQQRAVRAEQHQTKSKQNFIVRNLGTQPTMDTDRNKRFMVVKGCTSSGPVIKKPKMSNPSNRQPGRPPLMPAPSSAYTSRPYVANEVFQINRSSSTPDSSSTETNCFKISSVISSGNSQRITSPIKATSFYSVARGNGSKLPGSSSSTGSVSEFVSPSYLRSIEIATVGSCEPINALRPKNVQPVISVVPSSLREVAPSDNTTHSFVSSYLSTTCWKEENIEPRLEEKESLGSANVINKDQSYANMMDRVNAPPILSISSTDNSLE